MIDINWSTILLQIANFGVMAFILTRFFFRPVIRALDERSKRVTSALAAAEQAEKQAQEMQIEYDLKLVEANELVLGMKQQAQEDLERTKQQFVAEAQQEIEQMRDKAHKEMSQARSQAIHQHRLELGQLITELSARLIREAGGEAFQEATIDQFMAQLESLPVDQYQESFLDREGEVVNIQLVSANELTPETLSRIKTQVQMLADRPVEMKYKVNPALIAGATIRFGDMLIDGSVEGQLDSLRAQYVAELGQAAE